MSATKTAAPAISEDGVDILAHAIGWGEPHQPWKDYRNRYCVADGDQRCEALVALGLMQRRHTINDGRDRYYSVTLAGRAVVKDRRPKWAAWSVEFTWPGEDARVTTHLVRAETRGKARHHVAIDICDAWGGKPGDYYPRLKVTRARTADDPEADVWRKERGS